MVRHPVRRSVTGSDGPSPGQTVRHAYIVIETAPWTFYIIQLTERHVPVLCVGLLQALLSSDFCLELLFQWLLVLILVRASLNPWLLIPGMSQNLGLPKGMVWAGTTFQILHSHSQESCSSVPLVIFPAEWNTSERSHIKSDQTFQMVNIPIPWNEVHIEVEDFNEIMTHQNNPGISTTWERANISLCRTMQGKGGYREEKEFPLLKRAFLR